MTLQNISGYICTKFYIQLVKTIRLLNYHFCYSHMQAGARLIVIHLCFRCQLINDRVERITPTRSAALQFSAYSCVLREMSRARIIAKKTETKLQSSCHPDVSQVSVHSVG